MGRKPIKAIGWDGLCFTVPADWDPGAIDQGYLLLEKDGAPQLALRWDPANRQVSPEAALKRLQKQQPKASRVEISPASLPPEWQRALGRYEHQGFFWHQGKTRGPGMVLKCRQCHRLCLLHGYPDCPEPDLIRLLRSFADHPEGPDRLWAVFDIHARLPNDFRLQAHRFDPGGFWLDFADPRTDTRLRLYRWSPASALLRDRSLAEFVKSRFPEAQPRPDGDGVCWESPVLPTGWRRLLPGRMIRKARCWGRAWQRIDCNRILAVRLQGAEPLDTGVGEGICQNYETIAIPTTS